MTDNGDTTNKDLADELERLVWQAHRKPDEYSGSLATWAFYRLPQLLTALRREEDK